MSRPPWHSMAVSLSFTPSFCAVGSHEGVRVRLVSPRDRVVVATVAPCRSWGTLRVPLLAHTPRSLLLPSRGLGWPSRCSSEIIRVFVALFRLRHPGVRPAEA